MILLPITFLTFAKNIPSQTFEKLKNILLGYIPNFCFMNTDTNKKLVKTLR